MLSPPKGMPMLKGGEAAASSHGKGMPMVPLSSSPPPDVDGGPESVGALRCLLPWRLGWKTPPSALPVAAVSGSSPAHAAGVSHDRMPSAVSGAASTLSQIRSLRDNALRGVHGPTFLALPHPRAHACLLAEIEDCRDITRLRCLFRPQRLL